MALTLVEAAKQETGDQKRRAIIELYASSHPFLAALPFEDIEGNALSYNQEEALPGIGFRGVNESYTESTGILNPVTERLVIAGGDMDVDRFILRTQGSAQKGTQVRMKVKHLAHRIAHAIIKGDSTSNPREFDGLERRVPTTGAQAVNNAGSAAGLSLESLDEAIDLVDDPTHLIMHKQMRRRMSAAARAGVIQAIRWDKDDFGKQLMFYNDLPILEADPNAGVYASLDNTETSSTTSIYVVSWRTGMMTGIQNGGIDVRDLGEQDSTPADRVRVEWYPGLAIHMPRSVARVFDIDATANVVA